MCALILMEVKDIQPEGIKLIKSARGLMHWEIRIDNLDIDKLKDLNSKMEKEFGSSGVNGNDLE